MIMAAFCSQASMNDDVLTSSTLWQSKCCSNEAASITSLLFQTVLSEHRRLVQFAVMWLANANSAVNVFIYSATNKQFRRECVLLASRLCGSRFSSRTVREQPTRDRRGNDLALSASNPSTTINVTVPVR